MIRRILTFTVAFLVVTTAVAGPAFADRRDVTTTIGVDENGVTIKIDANLTGGGRTSGSRGGSGGVPCQYDLANIGAGTAHLYRDKPLDVNLFAVACGSYVDVRWLRVGPNGQPIVPGPTVDPYQLALSARDRLPLPRGEISANPARSLVGLPTWFWYAGYNGRPLPRTTTAFGVTVQVEARPTSYRWEFGDGTGLTTTELGRPYPARSPIAHTYQTAASQIQVSCKFRFAVRYRTGGGPWTPLPTLTRMATGSFAVAESQTVIGQ
jgi:hypothetical protein